MRIVKMEIRRDYSNPRQEHFVPRTRIKFHHVSTTDKSLSRVLKQARVFLEEVEVSSDGDVVYFSGQTLFTQHTCRMEGVYSTLSRTGVMEVKYQKPSSLPRKV